MKEVNWEALVENVLQGGKIENGFSEKEKEAIVSYIFNVVKFRYDFLRNYPAKIPQREKKILLEKLRLPPEAIIKITRAVAFRTKDIAQVERILDLMEGEKDVKTKA